MGGEILVNSVPNVGSSFVLRLPLEVAAVEMTANATEVAHSLDGTSYPGKASRRPELVLVAEDNDINQQVITSQLRLLGFSVEVAPNGQEALQADPGEHHSIS